MAQELVAWPRAGSATPAPCAGPDRSPTPRPRRTPVELPPVPEPVPQALALTASTGCPPAVDQVDERRSSGRGPCLTIVSRDEIRSEDQSSMPCSRATPTNRPGATWRRPVVWGEALEDSRHGLANRQLALVVTGPESSQPVLQPTRQASPVTSVNVSRPRSPWLGPQATICSSRGAQRQGTAPSTVINFRMYDEHRNGCEVHAADRTECSRSPAPVPAIPITTRSVAASICLTISSAGVTV